MAQGFGVSPLRKPLRALSIMFGDIVWSRDLKQPRQTAIHQSTHLSTTHPFFHQLSTRLFSHTANIQRVRPSRIQPPSLIHPLTHLTILNQSSPLLFLCLCSIVQSELRATQRLQAELIKADQRKSRIRRRVHTSPTQLDFPIKTNCSSAE